MSVFNSQSGRLDICEVQVRRSALNLAEMAALCGQCRVQASSLCDTQHMSTRLPVSPVKELLCVVRLCMHASRTHRLLVGIVKADTLKPPRWSKDGQAQPTSCDHAGTVSESKALALSTMQVYMRCPAVDRPDPSPTCTLPLSVDPSRHGCQSGPLEMWVLQLQAQPIASPHHRYASQSVCSDADQCRKTKRLGKSPPQARSSPLALLPWTVSLFCCSDHEWVTEPNLADSSSSVHSGP